MQVSSTNQLFSFFLLLCLIMGCQNQSVVDFTATPQIIAPTTVRSLDIGEQAPDFRLIGTDERFHSLDDYHSAEALVVVFTSNVCPYAQAYQERLKVFADDYQDKGVQVVAISTNSPLSMTEEDRAYSPVHDTYESMRVWAEGMELNYDYLYDGDDHEVALKFGPEALPHAFVFDSDQKLRYKGSLDFNPKPTLANLEYIRLAVDAVLRGGTIIRNERLPIGCDVQWSWLQDHKVKADSIWDERTVNLQDLSLDSLKTLLVNFSNQARMINFWATWCGPCKKEFPDLMDLQRSYGKRPFELITISLDELDQREHALKFLQQIHAPTPNFILTDGKEELQEEIFPWWDGTLPFSIIIEPKGELYKVYQGPINSQTVRKDIIDHRLIGPFPNILL